MLQYNNMHAALRFGSMINSSQSTERSQRLKTKRIVISIYFRPHRTITQKANINLDTEHRAQNEHHIEIKKRYIS